MNGFGASALLVQDLRGPEAFDPDRRRAVWRRLAVMLSLQLALMLALTLGLR